MAQGFDAVRLGMGPGGGGREQASQATRAAIPIEKLRDMVARFPTYSEAYLNALEELDI